VDDAVKVAVIVVTPETGEMLDSCLASLARQTRLPVEVVVVLNGCGGGEELAGAWERALPIKVVENPSNVGFAAAHDLALGKLTAEGIEWIAVINADAVAEIDWLEEMLRAGRSARDIGSVAAAVLMRDDPARLESLGMEVGKSGAAYLRKWGRRYREEPVQEVFGAAACACMYRREMIDQVGFFDPDMFAYYEDVDLAWRARWAGWRAVAAPRARAHHAGSAFSGFADRTYHLHLNRLSVIAMDWTLGMIAGNLLKIVALDAASVLLGIFNGRFSPAIRARVSFLFRLPRLISKRSGRLRGGAPGAEKWLFDDKLHAMKRLEWKLS